MVLAEVLVDAAQVVPGLLLRSRIVEVVVAAVRGAGLIRAGPEGQDLEGHRVEAAGGNNIAGKRGAAEAAARRDDGRGRVVDLVVRSQPEQSGQIAFAHRIGGNAADECRRNAELVGVPAVKPKRLILAVVQSGQDDGTADGEPVTIVLVNGRFLAGAILEEVGRIESAVANPPVGFAMQIVAAALSGDIHQRADSVADAGVERSRLDFELEHRVGRRNEAHAHRAALGLRIGDAVQREFVVISSASIGSKLRVLVDGERSALGEPHVGGIHDSRGQLHQEHGTAAEARQIDDAARIDHLAEGGFRRGQQGCIGLHLDRLGSIADLQTDIHLDGVADAHLDAFAHEFLEAGPARSGPCSRRRAGRGE